MNITKSALIIVLLALAVTIAGCHEASARRNNSAENMEVAWRQSVTGFWQPEIRYAEADSIAQEFGRR